MPAENRDVPRSHFFRLSSCGPRSLRAEGPMHYLVRSLSCLCSRDFESSQNTRGGVKRLATFQLDRPHGKKVSLTRPIVLLCVSLYPQPVLSEVEGACPERSRRVVKNLRRHCNPVASPFAMLE